MLWKDQTEEGENQPHLYAVIVLALRIFFGNMYACLIGNERGKEGSLRIEK